MKKKLNLACGHAIKDVADGWINLDQLEGEGIDIVASVPPIPFPDEYFDYILASHFLEHVLAGDTTIELMNECRRVLKTSGIMHVECPYWNTEEYVRDPTHVQPWNADKFRYFTDEFSYLRYGIDAWSEVKAFRKDWLVIADLVK